MIKISKKLYLIIILSFLLILCSCGNKYKNYPDGITLHVSDSLQEYFVYQSNLPTLHFDYNGVNAMIEADGAACFFVQNDQYKLSDKFAEHLASYDEKEIITIAEEIQKNDEGRARFGKEVLPLDEVDEFGKEQKYAVEKQIVACAKDGTRYSYQYRTFVSGGKRYYIYRYSSNIGISLEMPLMVYKDESGNNKLLLLALPYDTKYEVSGQVASIKSLIKKDTYLDDHYTRFAYPSYLGGYSEEGKINLIKDWYKKYCYGYEENNKFYFSYLGALFQVEFGITDAGNEHNQAGFRLIFVKD